MSFDRGVRCLENHARGLPAHSSTPREALIAVISLPIFEFDVELLAARSRQPL